MSAAPLQAPAPSDYVRHFDLRVLGVVVGLAAYIGRSWCTVSQAKILELLAKRYRRRMSRRHLNRHLGALERDGYLRRIRRHRRGATGRIDMHATAYAVRLKAQRIFANVSPFFARRLADLRELVSLSAVTRPAQCGTPRSTLLTGEAASIGPPT